MTEPDGRPVHTLHIWQFQVVRDVAVLGGTILALWLGAKLSVVSLPLLVALTLAYLCEPLVRRIVKALPWIGRTGAVIVLLATAVAALLGLAAVIAPPVVRQATALVRNADDHAHRARAFLLDEQRPAWVRNAANALLARVVSDRPPAPPAPETATAVAPQLDEARIRALVREELALRQPATEEKDLFQRVAAAGGAVLGSLGTVIGAVAGAGLFIAIAGFAFFTFAVRFPAVAASLRSLVPGSRRGRADELLARMDRIISGFVRGRLMTAGVLALIYAIGWTICGVPYALVLGLVTGALSLIPYLAFIGLPIAWGLLAIDALGAGTPGFYTMTDPQTGVLALVWWKVLLFPALVNSVAQSLEDYVLNPLIQGKATDLHPLVIMIAIIAGGSVAGLYGMILAVPAVACARVLGAELLVPRIRNWADEASTP